MTMGDGHARKFRPEKDGSLRMSEPTEASEPLEEIACENCVAACCKAPVNMQLTEAEHKIHSKTMDLKLTVKPRSYQQRIRREGSETGYMEIPAGFGVFELVSGCANLTEANRCSIYNTRPQCCRDYTVGSAMCRRARREAGLDADRPIDDTPDRPTVDATGRLLAQFFPTHADTDKPSAQPSPARAMVRVEPLDLSDTCALIVRNGRWIVERLTRCDAASWSRRTRCADWNVGGLAQHLLADQRFAYTVLTAALEGRAADVAADLPSDRAEIVAALGRAVDDVTRALTRITPDLLEREIVIGGSEAVTVQNLIQVLAMELAVHGLDIAHALGDTRHLTTDEVRAVAHALPDQLGLNVPPPPGSSYVLRSLAFELPFTWRSNAWQFEPGPDPCWIEGEPEAVLLYALGRVPFNKSGLVTNRPPAARAFKRHLVGP